MLKILRPEVDKWICMYVCWWNYLLEVEKNKRQFPLSTTEVEYYVLGHRLSRSSVDKTVFCQELLMPLNNPIHIYSDNTGMIACPTPSPPHDRNTLNIWWHFVRDLIHSKTICTSHIPGTQWCRLPHEGSQPARTWVLLRAFGHGADDEIEEECWDIHVNSISSIISAHNSTFSVRTRTPWLSGFIGVQMSASARALCLPTTLSSIFGVGQTFRFWMKSNIAFALVI